MKRSFLPVLALWALALAACSSDNIVVPPNPVDLEYADELDIDFSRMTQTGSGLWYEDLEVGEGDLPMPGDSVYVLYSGWLPDGTLFDSATDPEDPLGFVYLLDPIIPGFLEGVGGMRPGGARKLVIPPALGYGPSGRGLIPPNSTIVFRIELERITRPE